MNALEREAEKLRRFGRWRATNVKLQNRIRIAWAVLLGRAIVSLDLGPIPYSLEGRPTEVASADGTKLVPVAFDNEDGSVSIVYVDPKIGGPVPCPGCSDPLKCPECHDEIRITGIRDAAVMAKCVKCAEGGELPRVIYSRECRRVGST